MIEFKEHHDCQKPSMVTEEKAYTEVVGWWPFRKSVIKHETFYETRDARWVCPECGAKWEYIASFVSTRSGFWMCSKRPVRWVTK